LTYQEEIYRGKVREESQTACSSWDDWESNTRKV